MPVYTYGCDDDSHWWEEVRNCDDRNLPSGPCPVCEADTTLRPSLPLGHIWEERAAHGMELRHGSKEVHRGVLADGTPFETIGGPPPKELVDDHGGGAYHRG